jgi:hypothetical protein
MRRLRKVENYVDEPKTPGYHHESFQLVLYVYKTKSPAGKAKENYNSDSYSWNDGLMVGTSHSSEGRFL